MTTNNSETAAPPSSDYVAAHEVTKENVDTSADPPVSPINTATSGGANMNNYTGIPRKSRLFLKLCDMRTAVVTLNILNIVFTVLVTCILATVFAIQAGPYGVQNILTVLGAGLITAGASAVGLWSAMNWKTNGVLAASVVFAIVFVWRCIKLEWIDILVTALLLYPHVVLTKEMKSGVLSPETYEVEEYVAEGGRDFVGMAHDYISPQNSMV
mmetsp:Transcript_41739/g.46587  ORF Transcript_41739/g.46587 Transcript_41739/m.46587 type:complete len:213 (+) Transcript_41739:198-836(+)